MKTRPFNIEEAKAGKPVCTRHKLPVRILCFDKKGSGYDNERIVALVEDIEGVEHIETYLENGKFDVYGKEDEKDLMMVCVPMDGWLNIYDVNGGFRDTDGTIYNTEELAKMNRSDNCVATVKIEWYE